MKVHKIKSMDNYIFHVDLNTFFISAEEIKNPTLIDKPVIVAGSTRRSVVSTASYIARSFGIKSGESVLSALKKCPDLIVVDVNYKYYRELSNKFMNILYQYTDEIQIASIDECYINCTEIIKNYAKPIDLAIEIQNRVLNELQLKCSIGISYNKFLAKMASDMKKPMGITIIHQEELKAKIWQLPIEKMYGIGKKTTTVLKENNIELIEDLLKAENKSLLQRVFGINFQSMIDRVNGNSSTKINKSSERKSISISKTYNEDINDFEIIEDALNELCNELSRRMKAKNVKGRGITLSIKYDDYRIINRSTLLNYSTNSASDIFNQCLELYELHDNNQAKRLFRINISHLDTEDIKEELLSLF